MLIVIDKRIPLEAKKRLSFYGNVVEFATQNITYSSISDHPDIFLCQTPKSLICAPNLPKEYFDIFREEGVEFDSKGRIDFSIYRWVPDVSVQEDAAASG